MWVVTFFFLVCVYVALQFVDSMITRNWVAKPFLRWKCGIIIKLWVLFMSNFKPYPFFFFYLLFMKTVILDMASSHAKPRGRRRRRRRGKSDRYMIPTFASSFIQSISLYLKIRLLSWYIWFVYWFRCINRVESCTCCYWSDIVVEDLFR